MIARTVRTAASAAAILTLMATISFARQSPAHPSASESAAPVSTPLAALTPAPASTPVAAMTPAPASTPAAAPSAGNVIDSGWAPAPDSPGYDPNAKIAPSPGGEATSAIAKTAPDSREVELTPGLRAFEQTRDASYLDPLSWNITAYKSGHQLFVYYKGRLYRTYSAVFGRSMEAGTKLWEGDRRTPEGVYTIITKHPSRRWKWFLGLNYPNAIDRQRYWDLEDARELPVEEGQEAGEGGHIGIHGTDLPVLNSGNINWTTGCISVKNQDIEELNRLLPVGTVVIIKP